MDNSSLQSLLDGGSNGTSLAPALNLNLDAFMPFVIILTIISIAITILYVVNVINHWRVNSAILDIHKILREMNERQKATTPPTEPPAAEVPATDD